MKTGLVLEGGAMRGMFTCGALDVFMENGLRFDGAVGISAGAVFGCNYKSNQPGRALRYNKRFCRDWRYCSVRSLLLTGDMYGADFCYRRLPDELDVFDRAAFRANPMEFYAGATDVLTGAPVYHKCETGGDEDMQWLRASASMPIVSRPVRAGGYLLLDGGISDAIPYAFAEGAGFDRNVIILTQPRDYVKRPGSFAAAQRLLLRKYPALADALARRHEMYNRQTREVAEREAAGAAIVIRPPEALNISRTEKDPSELERVYQLGRAVGAQALDEVRGFIGQQ